MAERPPPAASRSRPTTAQVSPPPTDPLAYGTAVAIGAAFVVQVSSNTTLAYIGDQAHYESSSVPSNSTTLQLSGALDVEAHTTDNFKAISVGGALAAGKDAKVAVAGMANVEIGDNTTIAGIYDTSLTSPTGSGSAGAVTVTASNTVNIFEIAGGIAVAASGGGVGIGASANVIVFESQTVAETRNSNLNSSAAINVSAIGQNEVTSYAVTAGVGGSVGIGAAVGVILIGTNTADSDTLGKEQGQLNQNNNGTLTAVNASTNTPQSNGGLSSSTPGAAGNTPTATYNVSSVLTGGNDGVTAQIAGGNVAGTSVNVNASSTASVQAFVLGAGFGKNAGVGAGIAYVSVDSTVLANLSAIVTTPTINVTAAAGDAGSGPTRQHHVDCRRRRAVFRRRCGYRPRQRQQRGPRRGWRFAGRSDQQRSGGHDLCHRHVDPEQHRGRGSPRGRRRRRFVRPGDEIQRGHGGYPAELRCQRIHGVAQCIEQRRPVGDRDRGGRRRRGLERRHCHQHRELDRCRPGRRRQHDHRGQSHCDRHRHAAGRSQCAGRRAGGFGRSGRVGRDGDRQRDCLGRGAEQCRFVQRRRRLPAGLQ